MPWSNQTGGGSSNGNGSGGDEGPWGQGPRGPQRPGGGGGGGQPPDLEEILKRGQDKLKNVLPGGGGLGGAGIGAAGLGLIALALVGLYVFSAAYQVEADELAVETLFGTPRSDVNSAGLHFAFWPVERANKVNIGVRQVDIGSSGRSASSRQGLMLSGDQNIVNVTFSVQFSVSNPKDFLFRVKDPEGMVSDVAESAMREVVGRRPAQDIFRDDRQGISNEVRGIAQGMLDQYGTGIGIRALNIEDVAPPPKVADAFDEVQRAEQNEDQFQEEANRYSNKALGGARGEGAQIREDAAAYKNRVVQEAQGEAQRFLSVYEQYAKAPDVTRKRLFLETMEGVLRDSNKVIMENGGPGGTGVVPYLPLPEIQKRAEGNK